ncbi:DUF4365 domain-containing protein [Klebsiella variicola]|uniref:DUF4365 domain-containing protein n=1 Tax=Klebsiella variicola TaxID=244366 RepID=UPI0009D60E4E|nr:DUF4365 domain-containing protein [Klebsiella variicola]SLX19102.1 Uncharacterised protein [Klebsiella variicola]SLX19126.1 Uncharacterised protein [Klebsiella variicola]
MKRFKDTSITGWSGEYYFAYWVVSNFKWACRLLDIDIGVDAQVEVFDKEFSTDDFFAVQIKSTVSDSPNISLYLSDFNYWNKIDGVVVLVSIVLGDGTSNPIIYYKVMNENEIEKLILVASENKGGSATVKFNKRNILTKRSKMKWLSSLIRGESVVIVEKAKELSVLINVVFTYSQNNSVQDMYGHMEIFKNINDIWYSYEKICEATRHHKNLENYSRDIRLALAKFSKDKDELLEVFSNLVYEVKRDYQPEEMLPDNLHEELRQSEYSWVNSSRNR